MPLKSDPNNWRDPRHRRGAEGERLARRYLEARGWKILAHRFRLGRWEVDLIARRANLVAFVEVKTRTSRRFGSPLEAVGWSKQREIARVARGWIDRNGRPGYRYRFDVVGVTVGRGRPAIQHVEDAFRAGWR